MTAETILTNAILVLPEETLPGTLVIRGGRIAEIQPGRSHAAAARDLEGDHLIPGVVDVLPTSNATQAVGTKFTLTFTLTDRLLTHRFATSSQAGGK